MVHADGNEGRLTDPIPCLQDKMQKKNLGRVLDAATSAQTKQQ